MNTKFYTEETYAVLTEKLEAANAVQNNVEATDEDVRKAIDDLEAAYEALEETPVTEIEDVSGFTVEGRNSESNFPQLVLDRNSGTFWESPY